MFAIASPVAMVRANSRGRPSGAVCAPLPAVNVVVIIVNPAKNGVATHMAACRIML
jgi:hypothetical protein